MIAEGTYRRWYSSLWLVVVLSTDTSLTSPPIPPPIPGMMINNLTNPIIILPVHPVCLIQKFLKIVTTFEIEIYFTQLTVVHSLASLLLKPLQEKTHLIAKRSIEATTVKYVTVPYSMTQSFQLTELFRFFSKIAPEASTHCMQRFLELYHTSQTSVSPFQLTSIQTSNFQISLRKPFQQFL